MTKEIKKTQQQLYDELANNYQVSKRNTLINILECGKILNNAKETLPHGMFTEFIEDTRVSESLRTSQRLISVYKNFRHLLDDPNKKSDALNTLGISHLLELQKLPDRFKKEIEVVHDDSGEHEIVKVIDEDKLSDFLEQKVSFEGKMHSVKDLPLNEMKKVINDVSGIFTPENTIEAEPEKIENNDDLYPEFNEPILKSMGGKHPDRFDETNDSLVKLLGDLLRATELIDKADEVFMEELSDGQKVALNHNFKSLKSACEKLIISVDKKVV